MSDGWIIKTLGDIGKVSMCKRILKKQTSETEGIPFYKIGTFGKKANAFIPKELYEEFRSKYSFPKKGDVLISASGTIGRRVVFDGKPAYFQDSNIVWIDNDETQVLNEYLYTFYGYCDWNPSKGATISRLYNDDLRRIPIPIPPLPEQKVIVKILDEAFTKIDQAKTNIEKNIENTKELFQSKLNEIFSQRGDGWEEKSFLEVADLIDSLHKTPKYSEDGFAMVRVTDIKSRFLDLSKTKKVDEKTFIEFSKRHTPRIGDIIFSRVGSYGKSTIINNTSIPFCLGQNTVYILPKINYTYLYYFLNSPNCKEQIDKLKSGTTQPTVSLKSIKSIRVPITSLEEQEYCVKQLDNLFAKSEQIKSLYDNKKDQLEELKKSILQKAFSGELTKTEAIA